MRIWVAFRRNWKLGAILLWPLLIAAGTAYVQQSGLVTNGHLATWVGSGILQDAGTSDIGNISTLGITSNGGTPFCISSAKSPNSRVRYCLGVQAGNAAYMRIDSYNGASTVPFELIVNGTAYPFPAPPVTLGNFRTISSGTTDQAQPLDNTIAWNSSSAASKIETLYTCTSSTKGNVITVVDEIGTASLYPITVSAFGTDTINNSASYILAFDNQSADFNCNGAGNWIVK